MCCNYSIPCIEPSRNRQEYYYELIKKNYPKDSKTINRIDRLVEGIIAGYHLIESVSFAGKGGFNDEGEYRSNGFYKYKIESNYIFNGESIRRVPILYNI